MAIYDEGILNIEDKYTHQCKTATLPEIEGDEEGIGVGDIVGVVVGDEVGWTDIVGSKVG